jgi:putative SOS response-associated peptidase YedK
VPAVVRDPLDGSRQLREFRWGLVPAWAKNPRSGAPLINARGETVATKPAFRSAFKQRRCLIPADGFYEWKAIPGQKKKQPFYIGQRDRPILAFAGLWEVWKGPEQQELASCTIITTEANSAVAELHDRMPVILSPADFSNWLDPERNREELEALLRPAPAEEMVLSQTLAEELLAGSRPPQPRSLF